MEQYISKSAIMAEIERIKKEECPTDSYEGRCKLLWFEQFLSFLDTLEVKEVDEEYNGKAMLYVLNKGVEQGKREMLDKACGWIRDNYLPYYDAEIELFEIEQMLEDFRKAMNNETE